MGAKNHAVILPDANVDATVAALTGAAFGAAGQRCMAISAAVFVGGMSDEYKAALVDKARSLQVRSRAACLPACLPACRPARPPARLPARPPARPPACLPACGGCAVSRRSGSFLWFGALAATGSRPGACTDDVQWKAGRHPTPGSAHLQAPP